MIPNHHDLLARLPLLPGVYQFIEKGSIIYAGKAKVLRDRVRSYFAPSNSDQKVQAIVSHADDLEWIVTGSEVEALILENTLIKKHRPRYNIDLKDDKRYPYLHVTLAEPFPRIEVVRTLEKKGGRYFGPYIDTASMRRVLKMTEEIFHLRTCSKALPLAHPGRQCINFQMGKCLGLCSGGVTAEEYGKNVGQALLFLSGKNHALISGLETAMELASKNLEFEKAAGLRDAIGAIRSVVRKQRMAFNEPVDRDIIAGAMRGKDACVTLFMVREGAVVGRHHYFMKISGNESEAELFESFVEHYYKKELFIPGELYVQAVPANTDMLEAWLSQEAAKTVSIVHPQRGDKAHLLGLARQNAELLLHELFLKRDRYAAKTAPAVESLMKDLGLSLLPRRIEAYDISHIQGSDTVASQVTFINGRPQKSEYRRYAIRTAGGSDDYAAMREVIGRRVARTSNEPSALPDLFLIDGGKGQLSAALDALAGHGVQDRPVVSLAKRLEEVFVPGKESPVVISRRSLGLRLLQRIRDEAHRFAVNYHRKKRTKRLLQSELDALPGIGDRRKALLLKKFGSVDEIKKQDANSLAAAGLPRALAETLAAKLHG